jgi:squalene-associated FAD-dependent desaturase
MKIAVIGAGWAGLAAAVVALKNGHTALLFEASHAVGGRARSLKGEEHQFSLDNGQHILLGAYTQTLAMMGQVGVDTEQAMLSMTMRMQFPDGHGLCLPTWPMPFSLLWAGVMARGWSMADKLSVLRTMTAWQWQGFACDDHVSVAEVCQSLTPKIRADLMEPLCVSALNTPIDRASGQVFLRVLHDALFGQPGCSRLLLPRMNLSRLFPTPALQWLKQNGGQCRLGSRLQFLQQNQQKWRVFDEDFDAVILATSASNTAKTLMQSAKFTTETLANKMRSWATLANTLSFEAIATVYAQFPGAALAQPMLALRSGVMAPAQFVFDKGQLGGPQGLLAFVVSACQGTRESLQAQVLLQAQTQLGLTLQVVQTIVEKRATFSCTPGLQRPPQYIAPGLLACGDYVEGDYPATLEGAVRSAITAVAWLS